jgi:hypothetical protein
MKCATWLKVVDLWWKPSTRIFNEDTIRESLPKRPSDALASPFNGVSGPSGANLR